MSKICIANWIVFAIVCPAKLVEVLAVGVYTTLCIHDVALIISR